MALVVTNKGVRDYKIEADAKSGEFFEVTVLSASVADNARVCSRSGAQIARGTGLDNKGERNGEASFLCCSC